GCCGRRYPNLGAAATALLSRRPGTAHLHSCAGSRWLWPAFSRRLPELTTWIHGRPSGACPHAVPPFHLYPQVLQVRRTHARNAGGLCERSRPPLGQLLPRLHGERTELRVRQVRRKRHATHPPQPVRGLPLPLEIAPVL